MYVCAYLLVYQKPFDWNIFFWKLKQKFLSIIITVTHICILRYKLLALWTRDPRSPARWDYHSENGDSGYRYFIKTKQRLRIYVWPKVRTNIWGHAHIFVSPLGSTVILNICFRITFYYMSSHRASSFLSLSDPSLLLRRTTMRFVSENEIVCLKISRNFIRKKGN